MKRLTLLIILCIALMITLSSCNDVMTVTSFAYDVYRLFHECTPGQWETVSELSCTTPGINVKRCVHCGFILDMEVIAPEHKPVNLQYEEQAGVNRCEYRIYSADCSVCGKKIKVKGALDHSYSKKVVQSTCSDYGYEVQTCTRCGYEKRTDYDYLGNHQYETTYRSDGNYHWIKCKYCDQYKDKMEHTEDENGFCTVCKVEILCAEGITYSLSADGTYATVTGYSGDASHIKISPKYRGVPVTHIGEGAFAGHRFYSINIPDSITHIGDSAFENCNYIQTVLNGGGIKHIGNKAFKGCYAMSLTDLPEGLEYIGDYAFYHCQRIEFSVIPDGVTHIGDYAFAETGYFEVMKIGSGITHIGEGVFQNCHNLRLVELPEGLLSIGKSAFYHCNLVSVTLPDSTVSVGDFAFYENFWMSDAYLGGISQLGKSVFNSCTRLEEISVSDSSTAFSSQDGVLYDKNKETLILFPEGKSGTGFSIPDGVKVIADRAFYKANSIIEIVIPESVEIIGEEAFRASSSLKRVDIRGAEEIRNNAFNDCNAITKLTLGEGIVSIGDYAFEDLDSLTSLVIPASVTTIGHGAFMSLQNLTTLTIVGDNLTEIPDAAFAYCIFLIKVFLPESVETVGDRAFDSCYSLRTIDLSNVKTIGDRAFYDCQDLRGGDLRNAKAIGEEAFHDCELITSVILGEELEAIGAGAFNCFESLTKIYYYGTAEQWELLSIGDDNSPLHYTTRRYYYSESEPTEYGRFWHYDESGNATVW